MLHYGLILIISLATIFSIFSFSTNDYFRKIMTISISIIMWLAGAAGSATWTIPYSHVIENEVVTGTYQVSGAVSWLSYAWLGMAFLMFIYLFASVSGQSEEAWKKKKGVGLSE